IGEEEEEEEAPNLEAKNIFTSSNSASSSLSIPINL
ncbi:hypothetical protein ADUPG1_014546, partial [Aduncisulcus paluster]